MRRCQQVPVCSGSSPFCTLFCLFQLFFRSAHPADQQQLTTRYVTANSQARASTRSQPSTDLNTSPFCSSSQQIPLQLSLVHCAAAVEGLLSDCPDLPTLILDPLLLQLQILISACFFVAIEKRSLKFI